MVSSQRSDMREVFRRYPSAGVPTPRAQPTHRHVRDRVVAGDVFPGGELPVEHTVEPVRLVGVALLGVRHLLRARTG
jgi:hypothetical protein